MASLQRLDQIAKPDDFDDQQDSAAIANSEANANDLGQFLESMLSQLKRILHGDEDGNWHDDPVTVFGGDASLYALFNGRVGGISETLTYSDDTNKIIGPLSLKPLNAEYADLHVFAGLLQKYSVDYTVREVVGGGAPGHYVCIASDSTAPSAGSFSGGTNPGTGIDANLDVGEDVRVTYPTASAQP